MALDAQRNWTVSMAENLDKAMRGSKEEETVSAKEGARTTAVACKIDTPVWTRDAVHLPDEIIIQILEYASRQRDAQRALGACCLLSRQWYTCSVPLLYRSPDLYGNNYDPFVRAICPSINLHVRKSPLSSLVRRLDMSRLVHQGSRSMTARLLGRTKANLEEFVAPQASFAMNCFPALSKCHQLQLLDLSLVSESAPLPKLLETVAHLEYLRTLRLPRSSGFGMHTKPDCIAWSPNLEALALSGGIDAFFLHGVVAFPHTLRQLTIEHCPAAKGHAVSHLLRTAVRPLPNMESLKISNMPRFSGHALDDVLALLPQLKKLSVSVDYITPALFDEGHINHLGTTPRVAAGASQRAVTTSASQMLEEDDKSLEPSQSHCLHTLELTNSGNPGVEDKISPIDVLIAIDGGSLAKLRIVRVARSLMWHSSNTKSDTEQLADVLQEAGGLDWERREGVFAGMTSKQYANVRLEDCAGVWTFDDRTAR